MTGRSDEVFAVSEAEGEPGLNGGSNEGGGGERHACSLTPLVNTSVRFKMILDLDSPQLNVHGSQKMIL
ncbi:unnamed protein product [Pleuronectes platessa]|uniref:Uncharacterized protein n=1 Tax=Pleuronectes platessa TaxID=8262 RepID=A0A9N7VZS3_PLEPL|nr:unnamed protein product [Pleuronectes platessa]